MSEFRFRAAAALDLRRRQETDAATALARAEAELQGARQQAAAADVRRREAQAELSARERGGTDVGTLMWHRNWIVRLSHDLADRQRHVAACGDGVGRAEQRWRQARQRRLALERMQDRALRRFRQEQLKQELKVIDELARLRYVTAETWRDER